MAYMTIHQLDGNPDELLQAKQSLFDPVVDAIAPEYGALASFTAKTDTGLRIVNIWQSADAVQRFMRVPEVIDAQRASGLPVPSTFERFDDTTEKLYQ